MLSIPLFNLFLATFAPAPAVDQTCKCGYKDSNGNVWREAIISTFTPAEGALATVHTNWNVATYRLNHSSPAKADIQYTAANVMEFNDALGLKASAYDNSGSVNCSEIFTKRSDIKYGSFRMHAQVPSVPGVCFGFFTYINDRQEQDIEFLSAEKDHYQRVHYTNQPARTSGAALVGGKSFSTVISGANFTTFGTHRFDWLPSKTIYSYNGSGLTSTRTIKKNVPTTPSKFVLNVWSNGDPHWTKGPPTADAIATVQWVHLYFNSTSISEATFNSACKAAGRPAPCKV
ncbi:concanavalin A-like lectin/glucanase [Marasmius fiardii PR-910]|nr:concanavalin A-like lectin/glucanase [Marasmius fiardii PR-910]